MGNWPTHANSPVTIPPQLADPQNVFSKFYASKHNGRKLQWQPELTSAILKATFAKNVRKELEVSMFQALILLAFNDADELTFEALLTATRIGAQARARAQINLNLIFNFCRQHRAQTNASIACMRQNSRPHKAAAKSRRCRYGQLRVQRHVQRSPLPY